ncbi:MAG: helix-turn-helix domain-containing protein [Rhodoferax sp.]
MIIGPSGLVGDCALRSTRTDTIRGGRDRLGRLDGAHGHSRTGPDARLAAQRQLAGLRFRILLRHVAVQGANSSRRRVCLHLLDLLHSYGAEHRLGRVISIAFTQQEMGSICGLSRVSVSQIFSQLEAPNRSTLRPAGRDPGPGPARSAVPYLRSGLPMACCKGLDNAGGAARVSCRACSTPLPHTMSTPDSASCRPAGRRPHPHRPGAGGLRRAGAPLAFFQQRLGFQVDAIFRPTTRPRR